MHIAGLKVKNFKSFDEIDVKFGKFNVILGPNASGKSNFRQALVFAKDIAEHGLSNAISMQGGADFLCNVNIGRERHLELEISFRYESPVSLSQSSPIPKSNFWIDCATYKLAIAFHKVGSGYRIAEDKVALEGTIGRADDKERGKAVLSVHRSKTGGIIYAQETAPGYRVPSAYLRQTGYQAKTYQKEAILKHPFGGPYRAVIDIGLRQLSTYNFDPHLAKGAYQITGRNALDPDAKNLAIVLHDILKSKKEKTRLLNYLTELLPFVQDARVSGLSDRAYIIHLIEKYHPKSELPAFLLSDGTIQVVALIVALFFDNKLMTFIEEPERNLHPALASKIVTLMREAAESKQVFITTHNSTTIRHLKLEETFLASRTDDGFSRLENAKNVARLKKYLKHDIGLDDLAIQSIL